MSEHQGKRRKVETALLSLFGIFFVGWDMRRSLQWFFVLITLWEAPISVVRLSDENVRAQKAGVDTSSSKAVTSRLAGRKRQ